MKLFFRLAAIVVAFAFSHAPALAQQTFPAKPIRFVVPFPPGGSTDLVARLVGQKLSASWGQQVVVDNRPGGSTVIGTDAVAKAPPDGYTILLLAFSTHLINSILMRDLPYDSVKDFAPVATLTKSEFVLVVHPNVRANDLMELIALAKSKPGELNYASAGTGNLGHLAGELFNMMAGIKTQHVPYKGAGPAFVDLVGGRVQMHFAIVSSAIPYIKGGKLRGLAITGDTRSAKLLQVPTFAEAGMRDFELQSRLGVVAPGRTPKPVIEVLSREIAKALASPEIHEKFEAQELTPFISTPDQLAALMQADTARIAKIVKASNIRLD